jgi:metal-responsive CopG/Arc/MetJ family transcriptional regulator
MRKHLGRPKTEPDLRAYSVRLPAALMRQAGKYAKAAGITRSEAVRRALRLLLEHA